MNHHANKSPSSLPAKSACSYFKSKPAGAAARAGTKQHKATEEVLAVYMGEFSEMKIYNSLCQTQKENVDFALMSCLDLAKQYSVDLLDFRVEQKICVFREDSFEAETFGTLDLSFKNVIVDHKFGEIRDYRLQMNAYALGLIQKYDYSHVVIYENYGKKRYLKEPYYFTIEDDAEELFLLFEEIDNPKKSPTPSDYCDWCENKEDGICKFLK